MSVLDRMREMSGMLVWFPVNCPETPMKGEYVFLRGGRINDDALPYKRSDNDLGPPVVVARFDTRFVEWITSYFDSGRGRLEYTSPTHWAHIPGVRYS